MRIFFLLLLTFIQLSASNFPLTSAFFTTELVYHEHGAKLVAEFDFELVADGETATLEGYLNRGTIHFSDEIWFTMEPPTESVGDGWDLPSSQIALTLTLSQGEDYAFVIDEASGPFAEAELNLQRQGSGSYEQHKRMKSLAGEVMLAAVSANGAQTAPLANLVSLIGYHARMPSLEGAEKVEDEWFIEGVLKGKETELNWWAKERYFRTLRTLDDGNTPYNVWLREKSPMWVELVSYQYSQRAFTELPRELTLLYTGSYPTSAIWTELIGFEVRQSDEGDE